MSKYERIKKENAEFIQETKVGRPPSSEYIGDKHVSLKMSPIMHDRLRKEAFEKKTTISALILEAVAEKLKL